MANLGKKVQTFFGTSLLTSVLPVCTVPIQYHGDIESAHLVQYMVLSQRRRRHVCKEFKNLMKDLICEKMEQMRSNFKTTFHLCESTCLACPKCHQDINRCRCFKTVVCSFCCLFYNKNIKQIHKTRNLLLLSIFCILVTPKLCWFAKSACAKNKGDRTRPVKFFFFQENTRQLSD